MMAKEQKLKELVTQREQIIKSWNEKMEPLREARRNGEKVDWDLWDKLTNEMNLKASEIDYKIFQIEPTRV